MPVTFGSLDPSSVVLTLANGAMTQLYRNAKMPKAGATSLEGDEINKYYEKGEAITIRRPRLLGDAEDFDPRGGSDAATEEPGYVVSTMVLEKLFTSGFPIYSHDAQVARYIKDFSMSIGGAARKSIDDYFYTKCFRDWSGIETTGSVSIGSHPPIQIVAQEDSNGALTSFGDAHLRNADEILFTNEVPTMGRYARLGPSARNSFLGDTTLTETFAAALAPMQPGGVILNAQPEDDVLRRNFLTCGSNAVTGQSAVADLGDGSPTDTITAVVDDTTVFMDDDQYTATPIGAVRVTLGVAGTLSTGVAIGAVVRLGPDAAPATAYGVILRVDPTNKYIWVVPYSLSGKKLVAAQLSISTDRFSIPAIGALNVAFHKEHLLYGSRMLTPPAPGEGAIAETAVDENLGMFFQVFRGSYNVNRFRSSLRSASLVGALPTDHRKAVLMLSA